MTANPWTFGDPTGPGDLFNARDYMGRLVAFVQPQRETGIQTRYGTSDATRCRYVVVLDGDEETAGTVIDNPLVFGNLGDNAWANGDHAIVLGRIGQADAKPGQNPAYILDPASDEDKAAAKAWFGQYASTNAAGHVVISGG